MSSIDFTPVDATEGANLLSPIQCSNVNRGLYASLASSIATSTVWDYWLHLYFWAEYVHVLHILCLTVLPIEHRKYYGAAHDYSIEPIHRRRRIVPSNRMHGSLHLFAGA